MSLIPLVGKTKLWQPIVWKEFMAHEDSTFESLDDVIEMYSLYEKSSHSCIHLLYDYSNLIVFIKSEYCLFRNDYTVVIISVKLYYYLHILLSKND